MESTQEFAAPYAMNLLTHALRSWTRDGVQTENNTIDEYAEKKRLSRFHYFHA